MAIVLLMYDMKNQGIVKLIMTLRVTLKDCANVHIDPSDTRYVNLLVALVEKSLVH